MITFIKKHWLALLGIIVILVSLVVSFLLTLRQGGVCALVGLLLVLADLLINNDDKVKIPTSQSTLNDTFDSGDDGLNLGAYYRGLIVVIAAIYVLITFVQLMRTALAQ